MYPHTSTKIKLQKQIFLIDIFYSNYKENLYNIFGSMLCKVVMAYPLHNKDGYLHNKDGSPHHNKDGGVHNKRPLY